jgi:hypothetical protein
MVARIDRASDSAAWHTDEQQGRIKKKARERTSILLAFRLAN